MREGADDELLRVGADVVVRLGAEVEEDDGREVVTAEDVRAEDAAELVREVVALLVVREVVAVLLARVAVAVAEEGRDVLTVPAVRDTCEALPREVLAVEAVRDVLAVVALVREAPDVTTRVFCEPNVRDEDADETDEPREPATLLA